MSEAVEDLVDMAKFAERVLVAGGHRWTASNLREAIAAVEAEINAPPAVTGAPGFDGRAAPKFHSPALNVLEGEVSRANTGGDDEIVTEPCHGLIGGSGSQCRAADLATEPNGDIAGRG